MAKKGHCIFHYGHNKCSVWQYMKCVCVCVCTVLILRIHSLDSETTEKNLCNIKILSINNMGYVSWIS